MGSVFQDIGIVGDGRPDLQYVLQSGHTGNNFVFIRYIGYELPDGLNPGGFHHSVASQLVGMQLQSYTEGRRYDSLLASEMLLAGLMEVEMYSLRCQNNIAQYIVNRTILDMCMEADQFPVNRVAWIW